MLLQKQETFQYGFRIPCKHLFFNRFEQIGPDTKPLVQIVGFDLTLGRQATC